MTTASVSDLRKAFVEKYEKSIEAKELQANEMHEKDIETIKTSDVWLDNLLHYCEGDVTKAVERLWQTCLWRKTFGANDIDSATLNREYLASGQIYVHNKDLEDNPLLVMRLKKHAKSQDINELLRVLVFWIERHHHNANMQRLTMVFDMCGAGFSNVNLDFIRQITNLIDHNYPTLLTRIIVHELPFLLNATFKIVKTFLPAQAIESLTITSSKTLGQFIDKDNAFKHWGGNDGYEFDIDELVKH